MRYLLDTNVVSALVRDPHGPVADKIREVGETEVCTSIVVAAELRYGAAKKGSPRLSRQVEAVLEAFPIIPLEEPADAIYAHVRLAVERAGQPIGGNDLLIAAQGLSLEYVVVTANEREFRRVQGLEVENWLV